MAVYTKLSQARIEGLIDDAGLGKFERYQGITSGIENTNYFVWTDQGQFVLTLFEKRIDPSALPFVFSYQSHLNRKGINVPQVLYRGQVDGKHYAFCTFLKGRVYDAPTKNQILNAGAYLAKMHLAARDFEGDRPNPMGREAWQVLLQKTKQNISINKIKKIDQLIEIKSKSNIDFGVIHADYFPDNVFFDGQADNVAGVIDFYFSCNDALIYDLALAMNAWENSQAFFNGYQTIRTLSDAEIQALPLMRQKAALRIYLTRLYDWHNTPDDADVVKKDPQPYWDLIEELE